MQCPDKSLEGASNVLRQPETAVDLETDEAVKCAPCHSGGIDCCVPNQPVAAKCGDDSLHRELSRGQVLGSWESGTRWVSG